MRRAARGLQVKSSFSFGKGSPWEPAFASVLLLWPLELALYHQTQAHGLFPASQNYLRHFSSSGGGTAACPHSSCVSTVLLGLEHLPAALPLHKMPLAPCSCPLTAAWLLPPVLLGLRQRAWSPPALAHGAGQRAGAGYAQRLLSLQRALTLTASGERLLRWLQGQGSQE